MLACMGDPRRKIFYDTIARDGSNALNLVGDGIENPAKFCVLKFGIVLLRCTKVREIFVRCRWTFGLIFRCSR